MNYLEYRVKGITKHPHDLRGNEFGSLTAIEYVGHSRWECICACGKTIQVPTTCLITRGQVSCGCVSAQERSIRKTTHGESTKHRTVEYTTWITLKGRCENRNDKDFLRYGGRGICVCERWSRYENFLADMGRRPSKLHSIEREDNSLGYSPDNCVWALGYQQGRNKRTNVYLEFNGVRLIKADWARKLGMTRHAIDTRLKGGWTIEETLSIPKGGQR